MDLNKEDYTKIFKICYPNLFEQKTIENDKSFFENLPESAFTEVFGKLKYEDYHTIEDQVMTIEKLCFCFEKKNECLQLNHNSSIKFYDYLIDLYEKSIIIKQVFKKCSEIDKEAYEKLVEKIDYALQLFYERLQINQSFRYLLYFQPDYLKKSNINYGTLLKLIKNWPVFEYIVDNLEQKSLFLTQLKKYYDYVTKTELLDLENFWQVNNKELDFLCYFIKVIYEETDSFDKKNYDEVFDFQKKLNYEN